jgi:predicted RNA polymerase sigma factor
LRRRQSPPNRVKPWHHLKQPRDWPQIADLYAILADQTGSPVVQINRAIAIAEIDGPTAGLAILDRLDLDRYRYFRSTRAALLRRAGRDDEARRAYQRALELAQTEARTPLPHRTGYRTSRHLDNAHTHQPSGLSGSGNAWAAA